MSGSNNGGRDPYTLPPQGMHLDHDPYTYPPTHSPGHSPGHPSAPPTGRPTGRPAQPPPPAAAPRQAPSMDAAPHEDLYAPARQSSKSKEPSGEAIVPSDAVTGNSLTLVIAIMCFLACLTAGAVYMMNQSANAWLKDIASEVTVQVEPRSNANTQQVIGAVTSLLRRTSGINKITVLDLAQSSRLLEPWLGNSQILKSLPVPRLIALELNQSSPPDFAALRKQFAQNFEGVVLDDHRHWQKQIRAVTRSFALGGLAILLLVGAATMAIIVSAARAAMASNREIVEVLHFVGATDKFIAHEFERHFLRLGIKAGFVGAALAMGVFFAMPSIMQLLGGGTLSATEVQRLIGTGSLDAPGYLLLGVVVVVIATLCMITSRLGVYRILNARN